MKLPVLTKIIKVAVHLKSGSVVEHEFTKFEWEYSKYGGKSLNCETINNWHF